jgi:hypothetical protein
MPNQNSTVLATIGRSVAVAAGAICLIGTFVPSYAYDDSAGLSYWQLYTRWDVVTTLALIALIVIGVLTLTRGGRLWDTLILALGGFMGGNFLYVLIEHDDGMKFGAYLLSAGAVIAIAAVVLMVLHLNGVGAPIQTARQPAAAVNPAYFGAPGPARPHPQTTAPHVGPAVENLPAAGWYHDPSGVSQQRFWDGRNWTEQVA